MKMKQDGSIALLRNHKINKIGNFSPYIISIFWILSHHQDCSIEYNNFQTIYQPNPFPFMEFWPSQDKICCDVWLSGAQAAVQIQWQQIVKLICTKYLNDTTMTSLSLARSSVQNMPPNSDSLAKIQWVEAPACSSKASKASKKGIWNN